jgi:hypothetical protein
VSASQAECRRFEPDIPLKKNLPMSSPSTRSVSAMSSIVTRGSRRVAGCQLRSN